MSLIKCPVFICLSGTYAARSRCPVHPVCVLCKLTQLREQVRAAHLGQVYLASLFVHMAHTLEGGTLCFLAAGGWSLVTTISTPASAIFYDQ